MWNGLFLLGRIIAMIMGEVLSLYLLQHGQENFGEIVGGVVILYGVLTGNFSRSWSLSLSVVSALAGLMFGLALLKAQPDRYLLHSALFLFSFVLFLLRYVVFFRSSVRRVLRKTDW